ncbi:MAG: hypothetical protein ACE5FI_07275 [Anaerolineales bacterium]
MEFTPRAKPIVTLPVPPNDFWSRKRNRQTHTVALEPLGMPTTISANDAAVLRAVELSAARFSRAVAPTPTRAARIRIVVRSEQNTEPVPSDLPARLVYSGVDEWITVTAGAWGHGFANLDTREAVVVLSGSLAVEPVFVSRYFIDHYLTNFLFDDWGMLHASGVLTADGARLLLLIAPHNTGKSTTALRLVRAGWRFLTDSMVLFQQSRGRRTFGGYPVNEVKLRDDVLALFPEYGGARVSVREHEKTLVNLRAAHAGSVIDEVFAPERTTLCFVAHGDDAGSRVESLPAQEVLPLLAENTAYWDEPERFALHAARLEQLAQSVPACCLIMGHDPEALMRTLETLA